MEGFSGASPILVRVSWSDGEVPLLNPYQTPEGLRAETVSDQGVVTRWFAPWTSVVYVRQELTAEESNPPAQRPEQPEPPQRPDRPGQGDQRPGRGR